MPTPPPPLATATREAIVDLLEATGHTVHGIAPKVPHPPCLVVLPDAGWISLDRIGSPNRWEMRFRVLAVARDNDEGLPELEDAVQDVLGALADTCAIRGVTPPQSTDIGAQGSVLVSEVMLSIHVKE